MKVRRFEWPLRWPHAAIVASRHDRTVASSHCETKNEREHMVNALTDRRNAPLISRNDAALSNHGSAPLIFLPD